ncbi:hypothetical protein MESS4_750171 [Mesorhizobium sp. STM 4661]|nr:hypothetical protein MESS4_750171 [Mesorhizobium sp. STM 4661]
MARIPGAGAGQLGIVAKKIAANPKGLTPTNTHPLLDSVGENGQQSLIWRAILPLS